MNLLTDPVFRVRTAEGTNGASLPELLALLGEDRVESLPGLQRHQEDAFHIFCCYLAGGVLARQGGTAPQQSATFWLKGIRALTRHEGCEDDSAWILVVDDPTKPAFMQPPVSDRTAFEQHYKLKATTPDALDVLITAKNHDVKAKRAEHAEHDAWFYALISLNGTVGYSGRTNYGVARMNSGSGSRPRIGWLPALRTGSQFIRDVSVLMSDRDRLLQLSHSYDSNGKVLLWIPPWDGKRGHALKSLDPFFIEVARRIRLHSGEGGVKAFAAGSAVGFIAADEQKGNLGDPWIPITQKTNGALTVPESGLTPELLRNLIFGEGYTPAAMQRVDDSTASGWFSASVLVGGNCTTDGFHSAVLRVPEKPKLALFGGGPVRDRLAKLSKKGIDTAADIQYKALRPALFSLLEGGPDNLNEKNKHVKGWTEDAIKPFTLRWNPLYFDWLWSTVEIPNDDEALRPWFDELRRLAQDTLDRAAERAPQRHGRSYRAKTKAQGMFFGSLKKNFPQFMEVTHDQP